MKTTRAVVALPYPAEMLDQIRKALWPAEVVMCSYDDWESIRRELRTADAAILAIPPREPEAIIESGLTWLHCDLAGMDSFCTPAILGKEGLTITNASGRSSIALAEHAVMFALALAYRLPVLYQAQQQKHWLGEMPQGSTSLTGKTMGIIGAGSIGCEVARLAKAFSMRVLGYRKTISSIPPNFDEMNIGVQYLPTVLKQSDFVVLAMPLSDETFHMIGRQQLAAMKSTAFLINMARGAIVDEKALVDALESGIIAGAGLDTFATEPLPRTSPLWQLPNVLITPHATPPQTDKRERSFAAILHNIQAYQEGTEMRNVVRPYHAFSGGIQ